MSRVSSSPNQDAGRGIPWTQLYLGLSFTSLATVMLGLSLTRIFSVVFSYHFGFLAISTAIFGLSAGGVFSYVVASRPGSLYAKLGALGLGASASVMAALLFVLFSPGQLGYFMETMVCIASASPFFFAGGVVSLAIGEAIGRVGRAYFWDLAGAAMGCLLLIPFLRGFGGPNTVISAAVVYLVSSAIWFHQAALSGGGGVRRRATSVLLALLLVMLIVVNYKMHFIDVRTAKGHLLPPESFTAWNSFSRVSVIGSPGARTIVIDGEASSAISPYNWDRGVTSEERGQLLHGGQGLAYILRPAAKTLIIGAGGGYKIARALAGGSLDITAVEINPIIANTIMRDRFAAESHRIYFRPEVHVASPQDGRAFVRASSDKYQVIQAAVSDMWASAEVGTFPFFGNSPYASDAFYDYLTHLTTDGLMSLTLHSPEPSSESSPGASLRLVSAAMEALSRLGEIDPARHIIAVRGRGPDDTLLISRTAFTAAEIERTRAAGAEVGLEMVYAPGDALDPSGAADDKANDKDDIKILAIGVAVVLAVLILPRWLLRTRPWGHVSKPTGVGALCYFLCLGAGYTLIQIALAQRLILLLGHPEYALEVIAFSMLMWSGLGSYASKAVIRGKNRGLILVLAAIVALAAVLAVAAGPIVDIAAAWPIQARIALTAISVAPAAFLMGMPFPSALRWLEQSHAASVRWAWSVNSASSVVGSTIAILLAIDLGSRGTLLIGGALYLCALVVILATGRQAESS